MPHHGQLSSDDDLHAAGWEGLRGAVNGAAVWGVGTIVASAAAHFVSPVYRGLTFQFKVYILMSGMTVGSMIEADKRLRDYESRARRLRKLKRDQEVWMKYEADFAKDQPRQAPKGNQEKQE